jgi:hypothetical protein
MCFSERGNAGGLAVKDDYGYSFELAGTLVQLRDTGGVRLRTNAATDAQTTTATNNNITIANTTTHITITTTTKSTTTTTTAAAATPT